MTSDQAPARVAVAAVTTLRARARARAKTCSATAWLFCPGVTVTHTPWSVAAGMSTLSLPTPCRAMIFSFGDPVIISAVKVSVRSMTASIWSRMSSYRTASGPYPR